MLAVYFYGIASLIKIDWLNKILDVSVREE